MAAAPPSDSKSRRLAALERRIQSKQPLSPGGRGGQTLKTQPEREGGKRRGYVAGKAGAGDTWQQRSGSGDTRQQRSGASWASTFSAAETPESSQKEVTETDSLEDAVYARLPTSLLEDLDSVSLQGRSPEAGVQGLLRSLLESNSKVGDAGSVLQSKVERRVVLLHNPGGEKESGRERERGRRREERAKGRRWEGHMTLSEHRRLGTFSIPRDLQKYEIYIPLHEMWKEYIAKILANCSDSVLSARLLTADLHGAILTVVRAKDPVLVAANGIVVRDSRQAFHLITLQSSIKMIPKKGAVFELEVSTLRVTLYGDHLAARWLSSKAK